jgi:hypothetical protein
MSNIFDLSNKRAVITGGAGLLGRAHAISLLKVGANVDLWDLNLEKLKALKSELQDLFPNQEVDLHKVDITREAEIVNILATSYSDEKSIEVLINNAAMNPTMKDDQKSDSKDSRLENYSIESWNREIGVGLTGAFLCSKHVGTKMAKKGYGVILNIASDLSVIAPDQRIYLIDGLENDSQPVKPVTYSVIKSGLVGLTKYLATYWATSGIRANSLSPGGIFDNQPDQFVEKLTNLIPMGRMASPEDYYGAVQFLCSDASSYMTGQNLIIDGGRSVW